MTSFKYYKSYGIEYCFDSAAATVRDMMSGRPLETFEGGRIKAVEKAEKYIDSLNCA